MFVFYYILKCRIFAMQFILLCFLDKSIDIFIIYYSCC